ncbi:histidine kinase [Ferruginibacter yonginensis]|uniref:Histidine kinase n=1 Tax=Ferruginibacter yonginensis TaxID=1310416 RepID=A0ABV8QPX4_9BACT
MRYIFLFFTFLFIAPLFGQINEYQLINYTKKNGIPSNETYCVFRDSKNYMWIASDQGVVRYNGYKMEKFDLYDNVIFKIYEDEKGKIWFFSQSGFLCYYNHKKIVNYKYNDIIKQKVKNLLITSAFVINDNVYLNSHNFVNYKITNKGEVISNKYNTGNNNNIRPLKFSFSFIKDVPFLEKVQDDTRTHDSLHIDLNLYGGKTINFVLPFGQVVPPHYGCIKSKSAVYFFVGRLLFKLSNNNKLTYRLLGSNILTIKIDDRDKIWIGKIKGGVSILNEDLSVIEEIDCLKSLSISSIEIDYDKGIWFSTLENGVYYIPNTYIRKIELINSQPQVTRVCVINDSTFLFTNNIGLFLKSKNNITQLFKIDLLSVKSLFVVDNEIYLGIAPKDKKYLAESDIGKKYNLNSNLFRSLHLIQSSSEIILLSKSKLLICQGNYLTELYLRKNIYASQYNFPFQRSNIRKDFKGNLWVFTRNEIYTYDTATHKPIMYLKNDTLFQSGISSLLYTYDDKLIVGLKFGGLKILKNKKLIQTINEKSGLVNNTVKELFEIDKSLFVMTNNGISSIILNESNNYNFLNFLNNKLNDDIFYNISNSPQNLMIASSNGLYFVDKSLLNKVNYDKKIPFYINSLKQGDSTFENNYIVSLPYNRNNLKISFSAIDYSNYSGIEFYYKFNNSNVAWQLLETNELQIEGLSPGKYELQLKACNVYKNTSSDIESVFIFIQKPFWQKLWFISIVLVILIMIIILVYKNRLRSIKQSALKEIEINKKILEFEHKALRAQMNPHFVFNCLTSIQNLIIAKKNIEANYYLLKFASLIRSTLDITANKFVVIENELKYLDDYISLEKFRNFCKFEARFEIDSKINIVNYEIPSMFIQPIIENTLKHGFVNSQIEGLIIVNMTLNGDFLYICILDNGEGLNTNNENKLYQSYAMSNLHQRLKLLANDYPDLNTTISIKNRDDVKGVEVSFMLPYRKIKNDKSYSY